MLPLEFLGEISLSGKLNCHTKQNPSPGCSRSEQGPPGPRTPAWSAKGTSGGRGTRWGAAVRRPSTCQNFLADTQALQEPLGCGTVQPERLRAATRVDRKPFGGRESSGRPPPPPARSPPGPGGKEAFPPKVHTHRPRPPRDPAETEGDKGGRGPPGGLGTARASARGAGHSGRTGRLLTPDSSSSPATPHGAGAPEPAPGLASFQIIGRLM